jgi:glycosyltransferase involved in cell wall biosynthesis
MSVARQDLGAPAPKVTVVVPTFRRAALLKETVDSILAQTYRDFELVIVDNMSDDGTEAYVTGIGDPRVRYFRNPNNGIIAANRNFGIGKARGEYIALCDDDDLWLPEKLMKQVAVLEEHPEVALCYANASIFSEGKELAPLMMLKRVFTNHYRHLLVGNMIPNSTVLVRRSAFDSYGYLDTRRSHVAVEDYVMWLKIARRHQFYYIDEALIRYRVHPNASSANLGLMAVKSLRVCAGEMRHNIFSPFYALAFTRTLARAVVLRWFRRRSR